MRFRYTREGGWDIDLGLDNMDTDTLILVGWFIFLPGLGLCGLVSWFVFKLLGGQ